MRCNDEYNDLIQQHIVTHFTDGRTIDIPHLHDSDFYFREHTNRLARGHVTKVGDKPHLHDTDNARTVT